MSRSKTIPILWIKGLNDQEKESFEQLLRNSTILIRRLRQILQERYEAYESKEISTDTYDNPSWAYKQADINGAKRELNFINELFTFLDHKGE